MKCVEIHQNLFQIFEKYNKKIINFTINLFEDKENIKSLLTREYGPFFDGTMAKKDLSRDESIELVKILKKMEILLQYVSIKEKTISLEKIANELLFLSDEQKVGYANNFLKQFQSEPLPYIKNRKKKVVTVKDKIDDILIQMQQQKEQIDEEFLKLISSKYDNNMKEMILITFGIGKSQMLSTEEILKQYHLDANTYYCFLSKVFKDFSKYILNPKIKTIKNSHEAQGKRCKNNLKRLEKFATYFYEENMSIEEKEIIDQKVAIAINIIDKTTLYYQTFRKVYDEKGIYLGSQNTLDNNERSRLQGFKKRIKSIISIYTLEELQNPNQNFSKLKKTKLRFFPTYFYEENMPIEEINQKVKYAISIVKNFSPIEYEAYFKIYDNNEYLIENPKNIDSKDNSNFNNFKHNVYSIILRYSLEELEKLNRYSVNIKDKKFQSFYSYFYIEGKAKKPIKDKVKYAISIAKKYSPLGYRVYCKLYKEKSISYSRPYLSIAEENNFQEFKQIINSIISKYNIRELKQLNKNYINSAHKIYSSFYENFFDTGMTIKEKVEILKKLKIILNMLKISNSNQYENYQKIYDEKGKLKISEDQITSQNKNELQKFIELINGELSNYPNEELTRNRS